MNQFSKNLVQRLAPVLDRVRDIPNRLGFRPYRVFLVHTRWTENEEGLGVEALMSEREILPAPDVTVDVEFRQDGHGRVEVGGIKIVRISYDRFTEDDLMPSSIPEGQQFFYELRVTSDGSPRYRATPARRPVLHQTGLGWEVDLNVQEMPRNVSTGRLYS